MLSVVLAETLGTFFFIGVILATAGANILAPFAIGLALTVAIYFTNGASMGALNPAVALALFARGQMKVPELVVYVVSQFVGALLAVMWWKMTLGKK